MIGRPRSSATSRRLVSCKDKDGVRGGTLSPPKRTPGRHTGGWGVGDGCVKLEKVYRLKDRCESMSTHV